MLPKIEGFAAALLGGLDHAALATVAADLDALEASIFARRDLSAVLTDTSITGVARAQVLGDLLANKVSAPTKRLAVYATATAPRKKFLTPSTNWPTPRACCSMTERSITPGLSLLEARRRVAGYADALLDDVDTANFTSIEDDLFRWARTVEGE